MKKILVVIVGLLIVVTAAFVSAHRSEGRAMPGQHMGEMQDIVEEGTYQDLVEFRDVNGYGGPWWVDSEEDFGEWQEHHEAMGAGPRSRQGRGGCPMWD